MNKPKMWPIRRFLIVPATVVTLVLSCLFVSAISAYSYQNLRQDYDGYFEGIGRLFRESITNPLLLGQSEIVYRDCKLLLQQKSVVFVHVERPTGEVVCDLGEASPGGGYKRLRQEVGFQASGGPAAAVITIDFSLRPLQRQIYSWVIFGFLLSLTIVAVQILLIFFLSRKVAGPLQKISQSVVGGNAESIAKASWREPSEIEEITVLADSLHTMALRIVRFQLERVRSERDRVTSELARQIAHDIRSPVSALKILAAKFSPSSEATNLMAAAIERIEGMASDMLSKSRGGAHLVELERIGEVLNRLLPQLEVKCAEKGIGLVTDCSAVAGQVWTNVAELERVISNLVENAIEVSAAPMKIEVRASESGGFWRLEIADQGPGLPSALVDRLGKEEVESSKPGGNGMGVFKAYTTLASWGGRISHAPGEFGGTRFFIELPIQN